MYFFGISLNILSKDVEQGMAIMMDLLTAPRFQQDRFDKTKDNMLQAMKQRNDDTADIEDREWQRLIYGDGYWMNNLATQASVDAVSAADAKAFVGSLIRSGNLVVSVAGDFQRDAIEALLNKTIAALPKLEEPLPAIPQPEHAPAPGVYVDGAKIGALGLRVRRGCSYHGLSLNVDMDLGPFSRINPRACPLSPCFPRASSVSATG